MSYGLQYSDGGFVEEKPKVVSRETQYHIVCTMASHFDKAFFVLKPLVFNTDCGFVEEKPIVVSNEISTSDKATCIVPQ